MCSVARLNATTSWRVPRAHLHAQPPSPATTEPGSKRRFPVPVAHTIEQRLRVPRHQRGRYSLPAAVTRIVRGPQLNGIAKVRKGYSLCTPFFSVFRPWCAWRTVSCHGPCGSRAPRTLRRQHCVVWPFPAVLRGQPVPPRLTGATREPFSRGRLILCIVLLFPSCCAGRAVYRRLRAPQPPPLLVGPLTPFFPAL